MKYKFMACNFFKPFAPMDMKLKRDYGDEPSYGYISNQLDCVTKENESLRKKIKELQQEKNEKKIEPPPQ